MTRGPYERICVTPTGAALGADITAANGAPLEVCSVDEESFAEIERAFTEHLVLRFRGLDLDDDELADFSRRFGELDMAPTGRGGTPFDPSRPEITVLSNVVVNGKPSGALGNSELVWHQDMTYNELPAKASLLYGITVPPTRGDTWFYNLYEAYKALPDDLKQRIQHLQAKHDATRTSNGRLRHGFEESYALKDWPGAVHPLVVRHPASGRPALYLGRRPNAFIIGLSIEDSNDLLDQLWDHVKNGPDLWAQQWQQGDLVIWDNRCTLHRRDGFDNTAPRVMHRTQIRDVVRPMAA
jgi:taurine dioxygenase